MLKFDTKNGNLQTLTTTNLVDESLMERYDLQKAIVASWDAFCAELGMGNLYYVGNEIIPHSSCEDSIDILALDWEGTPIVIELKRDRDKLQLLQALSYAAMIATWTPQDFLGRLVGRAGVDDIRFILENLDEMPDPRIVLVAEKYDPEVILTADYLNNHDIDITAVALQFVKHGDDLLMSISRRYPLLGLEEMYVARGRKARKKNSDIGEGSTTWDDVIKTCKLSWANLAVEGLKSRGFGEGNPRSKFFGAKRGTAVGNITMVCLRLDNVLVQVYDQTTEHAEKLKFLLGEDLELEPWGSSGDRRSGWGFRIRTLEELNKFFAVLDGNLS